VAAHFVSEPLQAGEQLVDASAFGRGEPPLPEHFLWRDEKLVVRAVVRTWRSTNTDRGDTVSRASLVRARARRRARSRRLFRP